MDLLEHYNELKDKYDFIITEIDLYFKAIEQDNDINKSRAKVSKRVLLNFVKLERGNNGKIQSK